MFYLNVVLNSNFLMHSEQEVRNMHLLPSLCLFA